MSLTITWCSYPKPWPPLATYSKFSMAGCSPCRAGQIEVGYRWHLKGNSALRPVWPCPALVFQHQAFQLELDNADWSPGSNWPLSWLGTGLATKAHSRALTPPTSSNTHLNGPLRPRSVAGWPLLSRHVWTCPHTMWGPRRLIGIQKGWKRARGLRTIAGGCCVRVCVLLAWRPGQSLSDHWTSPEILSPPPDVQLLSPVSLLWARREELHQGWSRITGPASLLGWV